MKLPYRKKKVAAVGNGFPMYGFKYGVQYHKISRRQLSFCYRVISSGTDCLPDVENRKSTMVEGDVQLVLYGMHGI